MPTMRVITHPQELQKLTRSHQDIGFVPTMGALHDGHAALIKQSVAQNAFSVVSIFVNPTQFAPTEDLDTYPSSHEADQALCEKLGVDVVFMPKSCDLYGKDEILMQAPLYKGHILEGHRAGHFDGVLRVVMKLLHIVAPTKAYFGKKDMQQLLLIKQLVRDFFMPVEIIGCEIVRDDDGLALSSRNVYLDHASRQKALSLCKALNWAKNAIDQGELSSASLTKGMQAILHDHQVEYIAIVDHDLEALDHIVPSQTIIAITIMLGGKRYLDNLWV